MSVLLGQFFHSQNSSLRAWLRQALVLATLFLAFGAEAKGPTGKKVVVFYSSLGKGHQVAAKGIQKAVMADNPDNEVVMKDIRELSSGIKEFIDRKLYLFVVKRFPNFFDGLFRSKLSNGEVFKRFQSWSTFYDKEQVAAYLAAENPDVVLTTHYGAAEVTAALRETGAIRDVAVGWMHTDYFLGYFHRISKAVDKTFLPHPELGDAWADNEVLTERLATTGLPVDLALYDEIDPALVRSKYGVDPKSTVITISSGGEGVGDYEAMVNSIADRVPQRPLDIFAVCGANKKNFSRLETLKTKLPKGVRLHNFKFIPQPDLFAYIKMANVYVTKAGGLSPTEGFAFRRPMVIFDNFGGHERINAQFFAERKLSLVVKNESDMGSEVRRLLDSPDLQKEIDHAHEQFRMAMTLDPVVDFVRAGKSSLTVPPSDFGTPRGTEVRGAPEALASLEKEAQADVEILLSYSSYPHDRLLDKSQNPFGHIALAIDGVVYTVNSLAVAGQDSGLISGMTLQNYLYSLKPQEVNEYAGSNYGSAYSRDLIGLRIRGISEVTKRRMVEKIREINTRFNRGEMTYLSKSNNCANITSSILEGAGLGYKSPVKSIVFPLDTFDSIYQTMISDPRKSLALVNYQQIQDSKAEYLYSRFPLSPYQPRRLLRTLRSREDFDLFTSYTHRIMHYAGDDRVVYENVAGPHPVTLYRDPNPLEDEARVPWIERSALREFKKIERMKADLLEGPNRPSEILKQWQDGTLSDDDWKAYNERYNQLAVAIDRYSNFALHAKVLIARSRIMRMASDLAIRVPKGDLKKIRMLISRAVAHSEVFLQKAALPQTPKVSKERILASKAFFEDVDQVVNRIETLSVWAKSTPMKAKRIFSRLVNSVRIAWEHVAQIPTITKLALEMAVKRKGTKKNPLPVIRAINRQFSRQANVRGTHVQIENKQWLEPSSDPKEITLIVPTHREALNDVRIQAKLMGDRPHYIFLAPDNFAPKFVGDHVEKVEGLITVGRGRDKPIEQLVEQLKSGKSNSVVIYPEGSTDAGLGETRPGRPKLAAGLIRRLHEEGYKVRLVPVSYDYNVRPLGLGNEETDVLTAFVHKPIEDDTVRRFGSESDGPQQMMNVLRMIWLEGMSSSKDTVFGMVNPTALNRNFEKIFDQDNTRKLVDRASSGCERALTKIKAGDISTSDQPTDLVDEGQALGR